MDETYTNRQMALITAYEKGYRVIDNIAFNMHGKPLKKSIYNGYYTFSVEINFHGKKSSTFVPYHRLVAYQKYGKEMFNHDVVRHKNGNPLDNSEENIVLGSYHDNMMDILPEVRLKKALHATSKLRKFSPETLEKILEERTNGASYGDLIKKYGGSKSLYSFIFNKSNRCKNDETIQKIQTEVKPESQATIYTRKLITDGVKLINGILYLNDTKLRISIKSGYPFIVYNKVQLMVHRIIAYMKYGEEMFSQNILVRHLDGNKRNFSWDNIAIGTQQENIQDISEEKRIQSAKHAAQFMLRSLPERLESNKINS